MKAILEFNLPDDRAEFNEALAARKMHVAFTEMLNECRQGYKYEIGSPPSSWEELRAWVYKHLDSEQIDLDALN